MPVHISKSRLFPTLAFTTAFLTVGLIIFGAVVRVTDSGLGCGNHWPSCNGTFFPSLDNVTAWIEWLHRLFAVLIGAFGLGMLVVAAAAYRRRNRAVLLLTLAAAALFTLQSMLGALVVRLDLPPTMVTLHLGTAMLLLGALLLAAIFAVYQPRVRYARDGFTSLGIVTSLLALVIILTGALVRGSGATLACTDWPLCDGEFFPRSGGGLSLQHIQMLHRFAVSALGITLLLLMWQAFAARRVPLVRVLAVGALACYTMQAGVGAMYVLSSASGHWGAAHVGLAAVTWAMLVALSAVDLIHTRCETPPYPLDQSSEEAKAWQLPSKPVLN